MIENRSRKLSAIAQRLNFSERRSTAVTSFSSSLPSSRLATFCQRECIESVRPSTRRSSLVLKQRPHPETHQSFVLLQAASKQTGDMPDAFPGHQSCPLRNACCDVVSDPSSMSMPLARFWLKIPNQPKHSQRHSQRPLRSLCLNANLV